MDPKPRVVDYTCLERLASNKHSSFFDSLVSNSTLFSLELTHGPEKLVLQYTKLERFASDRHSSFLGSRVNPNNTFSS